MEAEWTASPAVQPTTRRWRGRPAPEKGNLGWSDLLVEYGFPSLLFAKNKRLGGSFGGFTGRVMG